jgi:serine/threonine-protein phosphatase 5
MVLQTREILQALPSLVDINVPEGKHFTVCGDVHGQVMTLLLHFHNTITSSCLCKSFGGDS